MGIYIQWNPLSINQPKGYPLPEEKNTQQEWIYQGPRKNVKPTSYSSAQNMIAVCITSNMYQ